MTNSIRHLHKNTHAKALFLRIFDIITKLREIYCAMKKQPYTLTKVSESFSYRTSSQTMGGDFNYRAYFSASEKNANEKYDDRKEFQDER
jgi:hypothetical protein